MNSDIFHSRRQQYFFLANFYLKQGISTEYVMVDIIYMGLLELWGARTINTKLKILVHSGIRTRYLPRTKRTRWAWGFWGIYLSII